MSSLSLLDKSIDDIESLAGFAVPPTGMYSMRFSTSIKTINDKEAVEASFEVLETLEVSDKSEAEDPATKPGTKFSTLFFIENEIALSKLKELMAPVAAHFNESNMLKLVTEVAKELLVVGKVKRKADKKDKDVMRADVSDLQLA